MILAREAQVDERLRACGVAVLLTTPFSRWQPRQGPRLTITLLDSRQRVEFVSGLDKTAYDFVICSKRFVWMLTKPGFLIIFLNKSGAMNG